MANIGGSIWDGALRKAVITEHKPPAESSVDTFAIVTDPRYRILQVLSYSRDSGLRAIGVRDSLRNNFRLDLPTDRVYYHLKILQDNGFVEIIKRKRTDRYGKLKEEVSYFRLTKNGEYAISRLAAVYRGGLQ